MSQSETLLLVALGFVLCAFVVLLTGRIFWNLAVRLGASRNAKQIPVAMLELQADRDRLRAEHAIMSRKLELRLDDIKMRMTEQMAEVSRSRNRVQGLVLDVTEKTANLQAQQRSIENLSSELATYKADLVSCTETIKRLTIENQLLQDDKHKLASKLAEVTLAFKTLSSAEGRMINEAALAASVSPALVGKMSEKTPEDRIKQRIAELTNLSVEMNNGTTPVSQTVSSVIAEPPAAKPVTLDQKLADAEHEAKAMAEELRALDRLLQPSATSPAAATSDTKANAETTKSGPMANVISLAQRIKALQLGVKE